MERRLDYLIRNAEDSTETMEVIMSKQWCNGIDVLRFIS